MNTKDIHKNEIKKMLPKLYKINKNTRLVGKPIVPIAYTKVHRRCY